MKVFVWNNIDVMSESYHSGGGVVIIANDLKSARNLAKKEEVSASETTDYSDIYTTQPSRTIDVVSAEKPEVFLFPNAGCC